MNADKYISTLETARSALGHATRVADSEMDPTTSALRLALHQAMAALTELLDIYVPPEVGAAENARHGAVPGKNYVSSPISSSDPRGHDFDRLPGSPINSVLCALFADERLRSERTF